MADSQLLDQEKWSAMAEALGGLGYWRLDAATNSISWSPNMFRIFGFDPSLDEPPLNDAMNRVHPDDRIRADDVLRAALSGEARPNDCRLILPGGELRYLEGRIHVEFGSNGAVIAVLGTLQDVTDRRQRELELEAIRRREADAIAAKGEILANISHELRSPLSAMLGFIELLRRSDELTATARPYLDHIAVAAESLRAIASDALDYSRLQAGQLRLAVAPASPARVIESIAALFSPQASAKGLALTVKHDIPESLLIDSARCRQVLTNLITNAIKFTDEGCIDIVATHCEDKLTVSVSDTGRGIAPDQRERLFQRWGRADQASQIDCGLGLEISRGLAVLMGGHLDAKANNPRGTTFTLVVHAPIAEAAQRVHTGQSVLIVDDSAVHRLLARAALEPHGVEIVEACSGAAALVLARKRRFDLILIDLFMPGISGSQTVSGLRRCGLNQRTSIVAFSAEAPAQGVLENLGFNASVEKPLTSGGAAALLRQSSTSLNEIRALALSSTIAGAPPA